MDDDTVMLYNCMGRDIHVDVEGELVLLPPPPRPGVIDDHEPASALPILIDGHRTVLRLGAGQAKATMLVPDPAEGVRYLVPTEVSRPCRTCPMHWFSSAPNGWSVGRELG
jgi:hypothetical protein